MVQRANKRSGDRPAAGAPTTTARRPCEDISMACAAFFPRRRPSAGQPHRAHRQGAPGGFSCRAGPRSRAKAATWRCCRRRRWREPGASSSTACAAAPFTSSPWRAATSSAGATCGRKPPSTQRHSAVLGMGVVAEYRGQGIGARMLATTLEMGEARGIRRAELVVRADNAPAIALYRRFGFEVEGHLPPVPEHRRRRPRRPADGPARLTDGRAASVQAGCERGAIMGRRGSPAPMRVGA